MKNLPLPRSVREGVITAVLFVLYFILGKFGLSLAFVNNSATAVWPPTGLALAAFLIFGVRVWPAWIARYRHGLLVGKSAHHQ